MRRRALLFILVLRFIYADIASGQALPGPLQYLSPRPDAKLVSKKTNLIVRFDNGGGGVDLARLFAVTGSLSGRHAGETVVSDDGETIVFLPSVPFEPGETVSVTLTYGPDPLGGSGGKTSGSYSFEFVISPKRGRSQPVLPYCITDQTFRTRSRDSANIPDRTVQQSPDYPFPLDFPPIEIGVNENPGDGYVFLTNFIWAPNPPPSYLMILDNDGTPVFFRKSNNFVMDFKKQPNGLLSYFQFHPWGHMFLDSTYTLVDSCRCGNGYVVDPHDLQVLDNGHYLVFCMDEQIVDMSGVVEGGNPNARVIGMIFQELDLAKNVVFEWRSWDHFDYADAIGVDLTAEVVDHVHSNAFVQDSDGNFLISSRHLSEVTKVDRATGNIVWRLGGRNNQFRFVGDVDDSTGFHWQHDIRRLPNGNVMLFDNGNFHTPPHSRAVEYRLDTQSMTATRVWQYRDTPDIFADFMGSAQRLPGGNTVIAWGGSHTQDITTLTEVRPDGTKAFELTFTNGTLNYKGYRFPWNGKAQQPFLWSGEFVKRRRALPLCFDKFGDDDVEKFVLFVGANSEQPVAVDSTAANTLDVVGLKSGIDYHFRVKAVNGGSGAGTWSNELVYRCDNTAPSAARLVGPPDSALVGTATVELSWTQARDAEDDSVAYTVHILQGGIETTIENVTDTFYVYAGSGASPIAEFEWTVSSADFEFTTASPDTFALSSSGVGFGVPEKHALHQNFPNPFNPATTIRYDLPRSGLVTLRIYNVRGQEVITLLDEVRPAGYGSKEWDGVNEAGNPVGSGVYFYRLQTSTFTDTRKMVLVR